MQCHVVSTGIFRSNSGRGDDDARSIVLPLARLHRRPLPEAQGIALRQPLLALGGYYKTLSIIPLPVTKFAAT